MRKRPSVREPYHKAETHTAQSRKHSFGQGCVRFFCIANTVTSLLYAGAALPLDSSICSFREKCSMDAEFSVRQQISRITKRGKQCRPRDSRRNHRCHTERLSLFLLLRLFNFIEGFAAEEREQLTLRLNIILPQSLLISVKREKRHRCQHARKHTAGQQSDFSA